jgi:hypothetical protein
MKATEHACLPSPHHFIALIICLSRITLPRGGATSNAQPLNISLLVEPAPEFGDSRIEVRQAAHFSGMPELV